jgi:hypothetical protein
MSSGEKAIGKPHLILGKGYPGFGGLTGQILDSGSDAAHCRTSMTDIDAMQREVGYNARAGKSMYVTAG